MYGRLKAIVSAAVFVLMRDEYRKDIHETFGEGGAMTNLAPSRVPYLDLNAQYQSIKGELRLAVDEVFDTSAYVLGPAVERFERDFAAFCGNEHCVAVNNGTAALHLALLALGIGPGDEVITQANTFIATVAAILMTGARAVLVDVAPPTYAIDVEAVAAAVTPRTKAIIPVHLFGHPCDLDAIRKVGERHGVPIVEDSSQAHGATYHGKTIGSNDIATFSFYPGKNLGAAGEGGGVVVRDAALAERMRRSRIQLSAGGDSGSRTRR
jgi:dTDP-4-amino-4,6-dideoxygalactose transaminase